MTAARLGITVMPEFVQCEGVSAVLRNILDVAGACEITTAPSVMEPADEATGAREPPFDGGAGGKRVLDRPLWGRDALFVRTAPSFEPDRTLYAGLAYPPPTPTALTAREGGCVQDLLGQCRARGVRTWIQVMAAIPPGVRVQFGGPRPQDRALLPDGSAACGRVDNNGSLASEEIRAFLRALVADLARAYPEADGFKFDWPEYPPYHFDSLFFDYSPAAMRLGARLGFDVEAIRAGMTRFLEQLPSAYAAAQVSTTGDLADLLAVCPVLRDHLRLRAAIVADFAAFVVDAVCQEAPGRKAFLQGFPPPWSTLSGFDLGALDGGADALGVKLYTMHWPMIEANYVERLAARGIDGPEVATRVAAALGTRRPGHVDAAGLRYPEPDEAHPADDASIERKVAEARSRVYRSEFWAVGHAYGPADDAMRRFRAALRASGGRVQLNRYGYMSDEKLRRIGEIVRESWD